jgi:hypothetical protein
MSFTRRNFLIRTGLLLPACALFTSGQVKAENRQWRRKWNGQLPLKNLPFDEAIEIIYDSTLPSAVQSLKDPAAARVHRECEGLILEFKAILKKANGNLGPYIVRIQQIAIIVPAGFNALVAWGNRDQSTRAESMIYIQDLLKTLSA